jgi:hypothetical protein
VESHVAKQDWNKFVAQHPQSPGLSAAVPRKLPKGMVFDGNSKKLPTPYGLFQEWLAQTLQGDWASTPVPGGFVVRVATRGDIAAILQKFPGTGFITKTAKAAPQIAQISYRDSSYGDLARQLGYSL